MKYSTLRLNLLLLSLTLGLFSFSSAYAADYFDQLSPRGPDDHIIKDREGLAGDTSFIQFVGPEDVKTSFKDVGGLEDVKEEVKEVVDFLKKPNEFQALGAEMPKGILLIGPPGTGKTLLARAVAGEANVAFLSVSGPDFQNGWIGTGTWRVKKLFKKARENAPAIIFIDEIDSLLAHRRYSGLGGEQEYVAAVNQFLAELDGLDNQKNKGIIVMGSTNQIEAMDKSALRSGRFDRHVYFDTPTLKERVDILKVIMKKVPTKSVDIALLAKNTMGFTGADLKTLINESAIHAAVEKKKAVDSGSIEYARDKILLGKKRPALTLNESEKKIVAYHEAGHTLIGFLLKNDPVHKVTISPRGHRLGVTVFTPQDDHHLHSKEYYEGKLVEALAGYVSETLIFGDQKVTNGSSDDIKTATAIAHAMVADWGFSSLGPIQNLKSFDKSLAEKEVRALMDKSHKRAKELLEKNIDKLHKLAKALLERESLDSKEIEKIIG